MRSPTRRAPPGPRSVGWWTCWQRSRRPVPSRRGRRRWRLSESRFDRTADLYADAARSKDWSAFVEWCRPQSGQRALDVGAGPGLLSAALSAVVAGGVALDPSQALLGHAPAGVRAVVG